MTYSEIAPDMDVATEKQPTASGLYQFGGG